MLPTNLAVFVAVRFVGGWVVLFGTRLLAARLGSASRCNRSDRKRCIFFIAASCLACSCWSAPLISASRRFLLSKIDLATPRSFALIIPCFFGKNAAIMRDASGVPLAGGLLGLGGSFVPPPRVVVRVLFDFDASDFDAAAFRALESIEVAVIALSFYSEQPQFKLALRTR